MAKRKATQTNRINDNQEDIMAKKAAAGQLKKEVHDVAENLRGPLTNLISSTVETSLNVVETVVSGVGEIVGAVIDEAERLGAKARKAIDAAAS